MTKACGRLSLHSQSPAARTNHRTNTLVRGATITRFLFLFLIPILLPYHSSASSSLPAPPPPPVIRSLEPRRIPPATRHTLIVTGEALGETAEELYAIQLVPVTNESGQETYTCSEANWLSSTEVLCVIPPTLPANTNYAVQVNVTHQINQVPTDPATNPQLLLQVDCYASPLCSACWFTPPTDESAFGQRKVVVEVDHRVFGLDETSVSVIFIIGAVCTFALVTVLLFLCCFNRNGKKRVAQSRIKATEPGEIKNAASGNQRLSGNEGDETTDESIGLAQVPKGVMISYSHANSSFALELESALTKAGFETWIDTKITPGEDWRANIAQAIELSFAVVVILSPTSVASKYCKEEIYYAAQTRRAVFPIVHKDCWSHLKGGIKMLLQRIQWLNFERDSWEVCFPKLIENLHAARKSQIDLAKKNLNTGRKQIATMRKSCLRRRASLSNSDVRFPPHQLDIFDPNDPKLLFGDEEGEGVEGSDPEEDGPIKKRKSLKFDAETVAVGTPLLKKAPDASTVDNRTVDEVDVYICVESSSKPDLFVGTLVRDYLREHGIRTYMSQRTAPPTRSPAIARLKGGGDGRASPSPALFAGEDEPSAYSSRRQSGQLEIVTNSMTTPDGSVLIEGASFATSLARSMQQRPMSKEEPRRLRAPLQSAPSHDGTEAALEDLFEANAHHIDASTMMIFIASAVSFKSPECTDELHYAYELSLPLLQVRLDTPGLIFHEGLLHGSVGMMLQRTPSVHWDVDGQSYVELTVLFHALKHRLKAEQLMKQAEKLRNRRRKTAAKGLGLEKVDGPAVGTAPAPAPSFVPVVVMSELPHEALRGRVHRRSIDFSPSLNGKAGPAVINPPNHATAVSPTHQSTGEPASHLPTTATTDVSRSNSPHNGDAHSEALTSPILQFSSPGSSGNSPGVGPMEVGSSTPRVLGLSTRQGGHPAHRRMPSSARGSSSRVPTDSPARRPSITSSSLPEFALSPAPLGMTAEQMHTLQEMLEQRGTNENNTISGEGASASLPTSNTSVPLNPNATPLSLSPTFADSIPNPHASANTRAASPFGGPADLASTSASLSPPSQSQSPSQSSSQPSSRIKWTIVKKTPPK